MQAATQCQLAFKRSARPLSTAAMTPSPQTQPPMPLQILRLPQVLRRTGLCRSLIYQLEAEDLFPKRVRLTQRTVGWIEGEIDHWVAERVAISRR